MANNLIFDKLEGVKARFEEVAQLITNPAIIADMNHYIRLNKEYNNLEPLIEAYKEYKNILSNIQLGQRDSEYREG